MTNVTYSDLLDLISNGQLVPDSEYCVTDYPTFQPILKARTESELWRDGYTSGGYKLLYDPFNTDGEYTWPSTKGWVYYLEANNNSAWFDFLNYGNLHNSNGVHIGPTFDSDGHRKVYSGNILQCVDVEVAGEGTLNIIGCQNAVVGSGNSGELRACQWVTVGDDNTNLSVVSVTGSSIGDGNTYVTLSNTEGVSVNSRNSSLDISGKNNIIGSDNSSVTLVGDGNEILNSCRQVTVTSGCNEVDESASVEIDSEYNKVTGSSAVVLKNSVGNTVDDSKLVYLEDVNNNDLWVNQHINSSSPYTLPDGETVRQYYPGEPEPFVRVRNVDDTKVRKVVEDMIPEMEYQTDNSALVVNTVNEKTKGSAKSNDTWYMGKDGLWNTDTTTTDEYDVTVIISKSQSLHCYTSGAGRYMDGQTCTVDYTWLDDGWTCRFQDENGNIHTAPYTFIVSGNTKVVALVSQVPVQPNDEIWYTSTDSQTVTPYNTSAFGSATITSNTYSDGKGIIKFDQPLTAIGSQALYACGTLASISLPATVTSIGFAAFHQTALTEFNVPASVTSIADSILSGNPGLEVITVDPANTVYDSRDNCNGIIETASNTLKMGCKNTVIPNTVTTVGGYAFNGCSSLTAITIPSLVTNIGSFAFYSCSSLASITFASTTTVPTLGTYVFTSLPNNGTVYGQPGLDYSLIMTALGNNTWTLVQ